VFLLHFASAAAQRDAMGRASMFLEDLDSRGTLVDFVPSGQRGGVANYSGHNMRVLDLCRFLNLAKRTGEGLNDAERRLVARLLSADAIRTDKESGEYVSGFGGVPNSKFGSGKGGGLVIAAVAGSSDAGETRDAVLHEAMHMVFYGDEKFARSCRTFWEDQVDAFEKRAWMDFLKDLRYDVKDDELVVNELQAYMCTERRMFGNGGSFGGGDSSVAGSRSSGGDRSGGRKKNGGNGSAEKSGACGDDALAALQRRFASAAREWLPAPPSVGEKCKVVWQ
jgi:hypothetical protein